MNDIDKIRKWNREQTQADNSLFVDELVKKGLTHSHIVAVLETMDETCHYCWDASRGCQCWNDE